MPYITMKMLRNYPISLLLLFTFFFIAVTIFGIGPA